MKQTLRTWARLLAIPERQKIVFVPLAAAVNELVALSDLLVKIVSLESSSAWP